MTDVILIATIVAFFAAMALVVRALRRLGDPAADGDLDEQADQDDELAARDAADAQPTAGGGR